MYADGGGFHGGAAPVRVPTCTHARWSGRVYVPPYARDVTWGQRKP